MAHKWCHVVARPATAGHRTTLLSHVSGIVAYTRTRPIRVDLRPSFRDPFVTARLISATQESGRLFRVPERADPNELTAVGPNA